jgi:hypothetical protein
VTIVLAALAVLFVWNALLWGFAALGTIGGLRSRHRAFWAFVVATITYVVVISAGSTRCAPTCTPVIPFAGLAGRPRHPAVRALLPQRPHVAGAPERSPVASTGSVAH